MGLSQWGFPLLFLLARTQALVRSRLRAGRMGLRSRGERNRCIDGTLFRRGVPIWQNAHLDGMHPGNSLQVFRRTAKNCPRESSFSKPLQTSSFLFPPPFPEGSVLSWSRSWASPCPRGKRSFKPGWGRPVVRTEAIVGFGNLFRLGASTPRGHYQSQTWTFISPEN